MDPNHESENTEYSFELTDEPDADEAESVEDFIRELEAKEKDLHITADTTFIELTADLDEADIPEFMRQDLRVGGTKPLKPAAPAAAPPDTASVKKLEVEIASLKAKVTGLEEERTELYKNSQRRLKDFEAYKARTERERSETFQRQLSNLATQMLPALDNLDRALQCTPDTSEDKHGEFAQFFDGIVLVNQQVNEVLVGMGIVPIATVGEVFDPHFHEAVAVDESSDLPPNTVTAELLRGFRIGDNVIRHSMVKVATPPAAKASEAVKTTDKNGPDAEDESSDDSREEIFFEIGPAEGTGSDDPSGVADEGIEMSNGEPLEKGFSIERNGETEEEIDEGNGDQPGLSEED